MPAASSALFRDTSSEVIAFFGYSYVLYFFLAWFPSYLTMSRRLSVHDMSFVSTIPWMLGTLGLTTSGVVSDADIKSVPESAAARGSVLRG